ncbi:MAG: flavin reductase [bacterium]|nr:flavin reductase [bacterium]
MIDTKVFRDISYGMYLVTTKNIKNSGCIINTLTQITSINPLISISLNKNNNTNQEIKQSKRFAVSIISENTPNDIITTFGYKSSKEINKFANIQEEEIASLPVITNNMCGYLICEVVDIIDCETHDLFIARVLETKKLSEEKAMTYKYYHEVRKGTSPKNAPTFIDELKNTDSYRCTVCGYIYDNTKEKVKFEDLPDDWVCPICGEPKSKFEKIK